MLHFARWCAVETGLVLCNGINWSMVGQSFEIMLIKPQFYKSSDVYS